MAIGAAYAAFRRAPDVPVVKRLDWRAVTALAAFHVVVVLPVTWLYIAPLSPFSNLRAFDELRARNRGIVDARSVASRA